jgi:hypothetical protein
VIVPVGRVLRPDRSAAHAVFLHALASTDGDGATAPGLGCCRCVQTAAPTE